MVRLQLGILVCHLVFGWLVIRRQLVVLLRAAADGDRTPMERTPSAGSGTCTLDSAGSMAGRDHDTGTMSRLEASVQAPLTGIDQPLIIPTREHLDNVRWLMTGDEYVGRGCRQRELPKARFCNPFKVSEFGRELAVNLFEQHLDSSQELTRELKSLSGKRLLCHCPKDQRCHADVLIRKFSKMYPEAYSRTNPIRPPTSSELNLLAKNREEPQSEEGSSADEGALPKGSGVRHGRTNGCGNRVHEQRIL